MGRSGLLRVTACPGFGPREGKAKTLWVVSLRTSSSGGCNFGCARDGKPCRTKKKHTKTKTGVELVPGDPLKKLGAPRREQLRQLFFTSERALSGGRLETG